MRKNIAGKDDNKIMEKADEGEVEVLEPMPKTTPFIHFHYSYKEISFVNGQTRIKSKKKQFASGKFESEEFEGTLGGRVYDHRVSGMKKYFFQQMDTLLKPFSAFLPSMSRGHKKNSK